MAEISPLVLETLGNGGEVIFTVTGNSMAPLWHHRKNKVTIAKAKEEILKKYDIPLFLRDDGKYILHRIVSLKDNGYVVMGDHQCVKEYPVFHSQVIGVVRGFWRDGRYISCDNFWYGVYCRLWVSVYIIRWSYLTWKQLCLRAEKIFWRKENER